MSRKRKKNGLNSCIGQFSFRYQLDSSLNPHIAEMFLCAVEEHIGGIELMWENLPEKVLEYRRIDNRKDWLSQPGRLGDSWSLYSGVRDLSDINQAHFFAGMFYVPIGQDWECDLAFYTAFVGIKKAGINLETLDSLAIAVGDVLQALNCTYDSAATSSMIEFGRRQKLGKVAPTVYKMLKEYPFLKTIPKSKQWKGVPTHEQLVEVSKIGWINYWSDESAKIAGLDEAVCAKSHFAKCVKTRHGWYFRLTDEPLDFDNPKHVDLYLAAFDLLPNVGIRSKS